MESWNKRFSEVWKILPGFLTLSFLSFFCFFFVFCWLLPFFFLHRSFFLSFSFILLSLPLFFPICHFYNILFIYFFLSRFMCLSYKELWSPMRGRRRWNFVYWTENENFGSSLNHIANGPVKRGSPSLLARAVFCISDSFRALKQKLTTRMQFQALHAISEVQSRGRQDQTPRHVFHPPPASTSHTPSHASSPWVLCSFCFHLLLFAEKKNS